jgi:hypothetical protein
MRCAAMIRSLFPPIPPRLAVRIQVRPMQLAQASTFYLLEERASEFLNSHSTHLTFCYKLPVRKTFHCDQAIASKLTALGSQCLVFFVKPYELMIR